MSFSCSTKFTALLGAKRSRTARCSLAAVRTRPGTSGHSGRQVLGNFLDPQKRSEIFCVKFRWRRSGLYPMKACRQVSGNRNAKRQVMQEIKLEMTCAGRRCRGRNLTARFMSARRATPGFIGQSHCAHSGFRKLYESLTGHLRLRRHGYQAMSHVDPERHGHRASGQTSRTSLGRNHLLHLAGVHAHTHVHGGGHQRANLFGGHGDVRMTIGLALSQPAGKVTSRGRNRGEHHKN